MTFSEAIKIPGAPFHIPDCSRDGLPEFFKEMGYTVGAEIGVLRGTYTKQFCDVGLKMHAIDPWMAFKGQGRTQREQGWQDMLYAHATAHLASHAATGLCNIIRKPSAEAVKEFKRNSLDFVYIDGDHTFPHVAHDIYEWAQRVRSGGVVSGHDYFDTWPGANNVLCHVQAVVDAYVRLYRINNWWLFGGTGRRGNDRMLSWMWVKP